MRKIWQWLNQSNRWKHLVGGFFIGLGADGFYCAAYAGAGVGLAMEFKDKCYGNKFDVVDAGMTLAGAIIGQALRQAIVSILT